MNESFPNTAESIEKERMPISKVFFVRHGASEYKEYQTSSPDDLKEDLLPKGEEEIHHSAEEINGLIDKNSPVRIIASTRVRTKHSALLLREDLINAGVNIEPEEIKQTKSFEGVRTAGDPAEIWTELGEQYGAELDKLWRTGQAEDHRIESNAELFDRIKDSFTKGIRILRKNHQIGHRDLSQVVLVSHGEIIEGLLAAFGLRPFYDPERKFKTGDVGEIEIYENNVKIKHGTHEYLLEI